MKTFFKTIKISKRTTLLDKYDLIWKEITDNVILSEIRHISTNKQGGTLETPLGLLICYKEDRPIFWRVKLVFRDNVNAASIADIEKKVLLNKLKNKFFFWKKRYTTSTINNYVPDKILDTTIAKFLLEKKLISEPYSLSRHFESTSNFKFFGKHNDIYDYD